MIRQSPEVPAAVELADLSKHIMNTQVVFADYSLQGAWRWQSPHEYNPLLSIVVARDDRKVRKNGSFLIREANLIIQEGCNEYWLNVPIRTAGQIEDDLYVADFVDVFRQYKYGRTDLVIPN